MIPLRPALLLLLALAAPVPARADRVLRDIPYGPDPRQRMDVYLPESAVHAPVLVMVHGGAWRFGDKTSLGVVGNKRSFWGARGYVVVSVNYRLLPDAAPDAQARDVARALALVQRQAADWGGDPGSIALMGHSAGAHLAALLAADPGIALAEGAQPWRATVALDSAALDVERVMRGHPLRLHRVAFGQTPSYWRAVSPYAQLTPRAGPVLLVCSSRRPRPCPEAARFAAKVETLGGNASVLRVDMTHAEINRDLGLPGAYTQAVAGFLRAAGLP
ncbi:alpha/beta hydrolase [Rhodovulum adriaticum]|uniref:Acetyl esterase/lipase n=1 Tax=Rhodovulum adriaticum TaxID=35804 RepID=A0A4R2NVE8_RHOAD|nr:alpha/beta hydrolase [Rhodovulum adriaticum]MBK1636591.1 hypothetical protein [Rhodovulum adriaticum]TCP26079.1 acetyl esterase/lipase [Rhodovulum adriaticum]